MRISTAREKIANRYEAFTYFGKMHTHGKNLEEAKKKVRKFRANKFCDEERPSVETFP